MRSSGFGQTASDRGGGAPGSHILSVKVTTADTQRWLVGGGWRDDEPGTTVRPASLAAAMTSWLKAMSAARAPAGQRRTRPVPVGVVILTMSG